MNRFLTKKTIRQFIIKFQQYLIQHGWQKTKENDVLSIWNKIENPSVDTLLRLPKARVKPFEDDAEFLSATIKKLAKYLNSSPEYLIQAVNENKQAARQGKISIRIIGGSVNDGALPFMESLTLLPSVKKLLESLAKSAKTLKPKHTNYQSKEVKDFIDTLKLGQTEKGSFILNVIYPIKEPIDTSNTDLHPMSFAECVESRMVAALSNLNTQLKSKEKELGDLVNSGVSADLCDALTAMTGSKENNDVEIKLHDSTQKPYIFYLKKDNTQKIKAISESLFNEQLNFKNYTIEGAVTNRHTATGSLNDGSTIVVKTQLFDKARNIVIHLTEKDAAIPEQAVADGVSIKITGNLHLNGSRGTMTEIQKVELNAEQIELPIQ
ncbi:MAG: hypothetical protein ACLRR8_01745 [Haemophilus parainfluenzae]